MHCPDLMRKSVGYRFFRVSEDGLSLEPPHLNSFRQTDEANWKPGTNTAQCYDGIDVRVLHIQEEIDILQMQIDEELITDRLGPKLVWPTPIEEYNRPEERMDRIGIRKGQVKRLHEMLCELEFIEHISPVQDCSCGFYSWHSLDKAVEYALVNLWGQHEDTNAQDFGEDNLFGLVTNWGRMEVHSDGVRSQYAEIMALSTAAQVTGCEEKARDKMQGVADSYGLPLLDRAPLLALSQELGGPVPESLRPATSLLER